MSVKTREITIVNIENPASLFFKRFFHLEKDVEIIKMAWLVSKRYLSFNTVRTIVKFKTIKKNIFPTNM